MNTKREKPSSLNLWWIALSFIPGLNWVGLLIASLKVNRYRWLFEALLYAAIFFVGVILPTDFRRHPDIHLGSYILDAKLVWNIWVAVFMMSWILCIARSFLIRKTFMILLEEQRSREGFEEFDMKESLELDEIMSKIRSTKTEIFEQIKKTKSDASYLVQEIRPLIENYMQQTEELAERDKKIRKVLSQVSVEYMVQNLDDLRKNSYKATNLELKEEYARSIEKYEKQIKTHQELAEQQQVVRLRLKNTTTTLQQIKMDLVKMEGIVSQETRDRFYKSLEEKSKELNEYLGILKESYEQNSLE